MASGDTIRFLLNGETVEHRPGAAHETLLDFLRLNRRLTGTKEGCAEGDCGACTVLIGRLSRGELVYETVNACIRFLASVHGCHVVTIEHLRGADGGPHPVQQAMVAHHGAQCGFCTPGIVMSLYGLLMQNPAPTDIDIDRALQGNLCRCTGYAPIARAAKAAGAEMTKDDPLASERAAVTEALAGMQTDETLSVETPEGTIHIPANADGLADILADNPDATIVAGATDVGLWVTKFMRDISPVVFIGHLDDLKMIEETGDAITFGAGVSYTDAAPVLARRIPALTELWDRIGGTQIRNMGTIGGNIANGSPIGDTPPPFIALGAELTLRKGGDRRTIPLESFFIDYGKQDRSPGEFVESITVPVPAEGTHLAAYKISKRFDEDISALLGAFALALAGDGTVEDIRIAFGGMAATPKRASSVEDALRGKPWTEASVMAALSAFETDFTPISDMRASADYRMRSAKNLLRRLWHETEGTPVRIDRGVA
ncbi:xanthine dehydrogenase small subunit [Cucumibacter marinus]|uniref:xanthine dehydrogenase small subunit n=1 Tax=Cucumibacter marinus TaxID=1121252 RepID=UPI00040AD916|nr:xanthine dehydrogenase small subunit [Cucumibacter marinus]